MAGSLINRSLAKALLSVIPGGRDDCDRAIRLWQGLVDQGQHWHAKELATAKRLRELLTLNG